MSFTKKSVIIEELRRAQMKELLAKGKRLDGRGLQDYRPLKIEASVIQKANGSALVKLGNTQVMAGVKIEQGEPFPDTPDKGLLIVNVEVLPLASPYAEPGPPDENAIELARVVDRGVRESDMIDLSKLVLIEGRRVRAVFVDVCVLNADGNLFDATSYAVVTALATAKMPKLGVDGDTIVQREGNEPLPLRTLPISVTMARIGEALVVDPNSEEEAIMDARLTLTFDGEGRVCAGQKGSSGGLTIEQIEDAFDIAKTKAQENRRVLEEVIGKYA